MKLKSILKTLTTEDLRHIEQHWGIAPAEIDDVDDEAERQDRLISNLYQRLQTRNAWETGTRDLADAERNLINFLVIHGGDLEEQEVCRRFFKGDEEAMQEMISSLAKRGIVFTDTVPGISEELNLVGVPEPFLRYIDLPSFWEGYLGHFLKELSNNELKHIATQGLKLNPENANKNYLIHLIREELLDPKALKKNIERLADGPRAVFDSLVERKGVCVYRDLLELNIQRRYDHSRGDALQWLLNTSGVVFTAVPGGNKYNNLLMIPRDIMYILQNHFAADTRTFDELDSVSVVEKEQRPSVILDNSTTLLRDIVIICNFVDRYPVRVLATGGIGKNDLKKVLPSLSRYKTQKYVEFLSLFLIEKKFLVSTGDTYRVAQNFFDWIGDSQQAYSDLLNWWLTTAAWNEEFVEGNTVHTEPSPTGLVSIVPFRKVLLEVLDEMPKDRWCVEKGFYEEVIPRIEQDIPRRGESFAYDKHTRSNDLVVESVLAEALYWLGIVAIGVKSDKDIEGIGSRQGDGKTMKARGGSRGRPRKQKGVPYTFRFTDLGRFIFSRPLKDWGALFVPRQVDEVLPLRCDVNEFIIQPTHEVIVPPDMDLRIFYRLNELAHIKSIDVMSLMLFNKTSVREGLDRGVPAEEILPFLARHSRTPVPDSLRILVEECSAKHGEVNMGPAGGYIVVDDEFVLAQIRASKKFAPFIKRVLDDHIVMLTPGVDLKKFARELHKIGFSPQIESEHVHIVEDERFNLSLTKDDMVRLIAAVKYASGVKDEKGRDIAHDRLLPLLERLKSDPRTFKSLGDLAEPLVQSWTKANALVTEARVAAVHREYDAKINHLVTTSAPKTTSKFNFDGPNPASEVDDILKMIEFAIDNEFEMEIEYIKANRDEVTETIAPESLERERVYAHCRTRDAYSVYRIDRIMKSSLV